MGMDDLNTRYGLEPLLGISELAAYLGVPAQRIESACDLSSDGWGA